MKKVGVLLVFCFLAVAAVLAVTTYSTAVVESPVEIKVVSTDEALLALRPGTESYVEDVCRIDEDAGTLLLCFTFTPQTEMFEFENLFYVKNNSADKIEFTIENVSEGIKYLNVGPAWPDGQLMIAYDADEDSSKNTGYYYSLDSGSEISIGVAFTLPEEPEKKSYPGSLLVRARSTN